MAEPAPTRRSSRTSATPVQATPETPGAGRATARREAAQIAPERPAVVWGRSVDLKKADAAPAAATQTQLSGPAGQTTAPHPAPASRRQRPAARPIVAPAADTAAHAPAAAPVEVAKAAAVAPVSPAAELQATAPVSRRARRAQTGEFAAVSAPLAPTGEFAAVSAAPAETGEFAAVSAPPAEAAEAAAPAEAVAPAPPFQLLEPLVESETAPIPAPPSSTATAAAPSSASASTWMSESFAKILAAEAVAAAATTAAPVETAPAAAPQPAQAAETAQARPATEQIHPLTGPIAQPTASDVDEFEVAARLFEFTGETPVQQPADEQVQAGSAAGPSAEEQPAAHTAPRRSQARRGAAFRRVATASFSVGVLGVVGLMAVGMTTPAEAVAAARGVDASLSVLAPGDSKASVIDEAEIQAYVAPAGIEADTLDRPENYTTTTTAQLASEAGIKNFSNLFRNDPNSNIQWPFTVGVTMSYGFGMRSGRMHEGVDFTPGAGAPIQAIADGTVRVASEAGGAYGVHVIIDHIVDGQLISSHYAHMEYGSLQVSAGQRVTVGTVLGRTGNTGRSYGAHTHFELLQNGTTAIDPMPWLRTHTDGTHTVG
jgi:murein DD-endopeptidase MepM/ murein hydrolase activator NlpD